MIQHRQNIFPKLIICISLSTNILLAEQDISIGKKYTISSTILSEERSYMVSLPHKYDGTSKLPVLYVLDAETHFNVFATIIDYLGRDTNIPPMMVVGVPNTGARENNMVPYRSDWSPDGGGADKFLDFFAEELIPAIDKTYHTSGFNIIAGKSYGGIFALYAATQKRTPFKAYISASPSVFLKDNQIVKDLWLHRDTVAKAKFIYTSHATEDDIMRIPFTEVAGILEKVMTRANSVGHKFYMNETHESVFMPTLLDAMRIMFKNFQSPRYTRRLGVAAIIDHYESIIDEMELGIEIPERVFSYIGSLTRGKDTMQICLSIFREGVVRYPNSSWAEYYLLRELLKTDNKKETLEHLKAAVGKAKKSNVKELLPWFEAQLSTLERQ